MTTDPKKIPIIELMWYENLSISNMRQYVYARNNVTKYKVVQVHQRYKNGNGWDIFCKHGQPRKYNIEYVTKYGKTRGTFKCFCVYKVAEVTNDKIISLSCLKAPYLFVVTNKTEFVNIKGTSKKTNNFGVAHKTFS